MYWHSGLGYAPRLVRICVESWQRRNPGWTVRVLDDASISQWVDMQDVRNRNPRITIQAFTDVLRWRLLALRGGIWADATLYCVRPLDDWLCTELEASAIFVFRSPEVFLLHSWFIAARGNSRIVSAMTEEMTGFTCRHGGFRHYFDLRAVWRIYYLVEKYAGRGNYFIWRTWPFRRLLKAAPYFFQNYLLGYLISRSAECRGEFEGVSTRYGEAPHALQSMTQNGQPQSLDAVRHILESDCPVQKLTLKRYVKEWTDGGILDLLDRHGRDA